MEEKQSIRRWIIFTIASLLFLLSQFYRASIAVITPQLIADTGINTRELSLISAGVFYAFALAQIPIGIYLDRFGARRTMTCLSIVAALGALVFAWADSFQGLMAGRLLLGIGMACNLMGPLKLLTLWFSPARFATLTALVVSIGTAGNLIAATPLVLLVQAFGWRITFTLFSAATLVMVMIFFAVVTDGPKSLSQTHVEDTRPTLGDTLSGIGNLFHTKDYWIISLGTFCRYGIFAAFQALWAGPFLMNAMGLSAITTGNMIFLMNIGLIFGLPLWGILSDRILDTRKGVVIGGLAGFSVILLTMAFLPASVNQTVLYTLFFLCGIFSSSGMVMYSHIKERVPLNKAGAAMTGINFFTMAGAAIFLQGLGAIMQHFFPVDTLGSSAFQTAFIVCSACLGATALLYLQTRENRKIGVSA